MLPPNIKDVLGKEHLCFHVHRVVEALEVSGFEQAYGAEGRLAYPPRMMLKLWLYAFCLRLTSTRRLEQRVREDLALRYVAGGLMPDRKTLSEFLRRHRRAINDVFTQVSLTDPDSRFLRSRQGWALRYTADMAVSDDHFIAATRVTQNATDNASLVPMVDEVERQCRQRPEQVTAESGFFSFVAWLRLLRNGCWPPSPTTSSV